MVVLDDMPLVVPNALLIVPVGIGSSEPTWIRAGRLSVASTLGEEIILTRESVAKARISAWTVLSPTMAVAPMLVMAPLALGAPNRPPRPRKAPKDRNP